MWNDCIGVQESVCARAREWVLQEVLVGNGKLWKHHAVNLRVLNQRINATPQPLPVTKTRVLKPKRSRVCGHDVSKH